MTNECREAQIQLRYIPLWSNMVYFLAAIFALRHRMKFVGTILMITTIISTLHHLGTERIWYYSSIWYKLFLKFDEIMVSILFTVMVLAVLTKDFETDNYKKIIENIKKPIVMLAITFCLSGAFLYFYANTFWTETGHHMLYDFYHSIWHILTGFAVILVIIAVS